MIELYYNVQSPLFLYKTWKGCLFIPIDLTKQIKTKILVVILLTFGTLGACSVNHAHADSNNTSSQSNIQLSNNIITTNSQNQQQQIQQNNNSQSSKQNNNVAINNKSVSNALPSNAQTDNRVASYDISGWQGLITANQAQQLKNEVHFMILKADQGSYEDTDFANNAYQLRKAHVPYGAYDYSVYANPTQAQNEAHALVEQAPQAKFYVNDSEVNEAGSNLDSATQAWANEIHYLTRKPAVLYSDLSFLNDNFSQTTRNLYNAIWVAAYGTEPDPTWHYDLWQFSSNHYSPALNQDVDASTFPDGNDKPLSFWTGHTRYRYHPSHNNAIHFHIRPKKKFIYHHVKIHHHKIKYKHHVKKHYHIIHVHKHRHIHKHKNITIHKHHYTYKKPRMWTASYYYHKIPQARWLKVIKPSGIELWGKGHIDDGHVSKGTTLYVSKYIKVRDHNHYIYKAQGIHYGLPDWFTANMYNMTDNC